MSRPPGVDVGLDLNPRSFGLRSQIEFLREHCRQHPTQDVSDATVELYKRGKGPRDWLLEPRGCIPLSSKIVWGGMF